MTKTKIAVFVEGGCVTAVRSNDPNVECVIVDYDNLDDEADECAPFFSDGTGTDGEVLRYEIA